jgi:threonyl-tRNA synthetase
LCRIERRILFHLKQYSYRIAPTRRREVGACRRFELYCEGE